MSANEETLQTARKHLQDIFAKYQRNGMLALYIWGSVTRDDFDPATSDIDCIAIVDEAFPLELNEAIKGALNIAMPDTEWGFQIIYRSELDGGPLKSRVAKVMAPRIILSSFQDWIWIAGRQFKQTDFALGETTLAELTRLVVETIDRRLAGLDDPDTYRQERNRKGLVKACLQLIYCRQQMRSGCFPLNYNRLQDRADGMERPVLTELLTVKNDQLHSRERFESLVPQIVAFRDKISHELGA
jgi:hypothetical protein